MARQDFEAACKLAARGRNPVAGNAVRANVLGALAPEGWPLWVDSRDKSLAHHLIAGGHWESWITLAMAARIQPDWCCVDVGANFGYYTLLMAHLAPQGRTLAVEPSPLMCELLERSIKDNELTNCEVVKRAAWSSSGVELNLIVPLEVYMGGAYVMPASGGSIACTSATLDDLLLDWPRVDLIKIDAEGAEPAIWEGMVGTLKRHKPIVVLEFSGSIYPDALGFAQRIQADGYPLAIIDGASRIVPTTPEALAKVRTLEMLWLERA